jgi:hypothetical protein
VSALVSIVTSGLLWSRVKDILIVMLMSVKSTDGEAVMKSGYDLNCIRTVSGFSLNGGDSEEKEAVERKAKRPKLYSQPVSPPVHVTDNSEILTTQPVLSRVQDVDAENHAVTDRGIDIGSGRTETEINRVHVPPSPEFPFGLAYAGACEHAVFGAPYALGLRCEVEVSKRTFNALCLAKMVLGKTGYLLPSNQMIVDTIYKFDDLKLTSRHSMANAKALLAAGGGGNCYHTNNVHFLLACRMLMDVYKRATSEEKAHLPTKIWIVTTPPREDTPHYFVIIGDPQDKQSVVLDGWPHYKCPHTRDRCIFDIEGVTEDEDELSYESVQESETISDINIAQNSKQTSVSDESYCSEIEGETDHSVRRGGVDCWTVGNPTTDRGIAIDGFPNDEELETFRNGVVYVRRSEEDRKEVVDSIQSGLRPVDDYGFSFNVNAPLPIYMCGDHSFDPYFVNQKMTDDMCALNNEYIEILSNYRSSNLNQHEYEQIDSENHEDSSESKDDVPKLSHVNNGVSGSTSNDSYSKEGPGLLDELFNDY